MLLDIEALSFNALNCLEPCVCGSHSFYLDDQMQWQCSWCKPKQPLETIRCALDEEPSPTDIAKSLWWLGLRFLQQD
jgi:hypothetical protein